MIIYQKLRSNSVIKPFIKMFHLMRKYSVASSHNLFKSLEKKRAISEKEMKYFLYD